MQYSFGRNFSSALEAAYTRQAREKLLERQQAFQSSEAQKQRDFRHREQQDLFGHQNEMQQSNFNQQEHMSDVNFGHEEKLTEKRHGYRVDEIGVRADANLTNGKELVKFNRGLQNQDELNRLNALKGVNSLNIGYDLYKDNPQAYAIYKAKKLNNLYAYADQHPEQAKYLYDEIKNLQGLTASELYPGSSAPMNISTRISMYNNGIPLPNFSGGNFIDYSQTRNPATGYGLLQQIFNHGTLWRN